MTNREIKFRAWDKERRKILNFGQIVPIRWIYDGSLEDMFDNCQDDISLMQYTGLKDTNGKSIYEGDIVKVNYNYLGTHVVKFSKGKYNTASYICDKCEVIGNIYENPELFEEGIT